MTPCRISLLGLCLDLYHTMIPEYIPVYQENLERYGAILGQRGMLVSRRLCFRRDEVDAAVSDAEAADADVLVIVYLAYAPSMIALPRLVRTHLPLLIWNVQNLAGITPDFSARQRIENHAIQGHQDLCNGLVRARRPFGLASGHDADPRHLAALDDWLAACRAVSLSRKLRVGLLGRPFPGMGDFGVDETLMALRWGPDVVDIPMADLAAHFEAIAPSAVDAEIADDHARFDIDPAVEPEHHRYSARLALALRRLAAERNLHAFTTNFGSFVNCPSIQTAPFLGINHLIAANHGYAGEGNVTIAALDALLGRLFGQSNFCEMFTPDYANDRLFFYHMAEGNYAMARPAPPPRLIQVPFFPDSCRPYLTPVYRYEPGPSTFVNLTTDAEERFRLIAFEADVTDDGLDEPMTAPYFFIRAAGRVGDLIDAYGMAGGTHHLCRIRGRRSDQLARIARMLGMDWVRL